MEFLGAELSTGSAFDASAVRLNVPTRRLEQALPIMADVALRPTFPAAELERLRQERLTALLQTRDDPAGVATPAFWRVVYGAAHRYGTNAIGTTATLTAFTTEQLRAFHAAAYRPDNAALVVVGDVTLAGVVPMLERAFGAWSAAERVAQTPLPEPAQLTAREVTIVDMPGAEQSQIRIGAVGVARSTPDYFALQVLNTVLGGSFTSRLNQNLREEHGYAYGAGSRFDMRLSAGPFTASAGVQTDKTAESLTEFFNELEAIAAPIGADELAKAKNYLGVGVPRRLRDLGRPRRASRGARHLRFAGQLLRRVHGQDRGCDDRRRAAGSRRAHSAGQRRCRRRRRSTGDRAWHSRPESRPRASGQGGRGRALGVPWAVPGRAAGCDWLRVPRTNRRL